MIQNALFELMKEKCFSQITVSEIAERADVARRTFYRLYEGKRDVLRSYFSDLCCDYCRRYEPLEHYDIGQIAREYFSFWYEYREPLLLMHKCGLDDVLYYEISRTSTEVVKKRMDDGNLKNDLDMEFFAGYSAGGFLNLLHRWIADGMQEAPEKYAESVSKALLRFIIK